MTLELVIRNWALVGASVLGTAVLLFVLFRVYQDSGRGRLGARVRELRSCEQEAVRAHRAAEKAAGRLARLRARAASVKPRLVQEAEGALEDARALHKIAEDKVLIARNHVRKLIVEEYPPTRHDVLRRRLLPSDEPEGKPFTMDN